MAVVKKKITILSSTNIPFRIKEMILFYGFSFIFRHIEISNFIAVDHLIILIQIKKKKKAIEQIVQNSVQ